MNTENFLLEQMSKGTEKFGEQAKESKAEDRSMWSQLIGVQSAVLGISISLLGYRQVEPGVFLLITWVLEIVSIITGFVVLALDTKQTFQGAMHSWLFFSDTNDIQLKEASGELRDQNKKMGMFVAACLKNPIFKKEVNFTDEALRLAEKYKGELLSSKMLKDVPLTWRSKIAAFLLPHLQTITDIFYTSFALSFITLLSSLVLKG